MKNQQRLTLNAMTLKIFFLGFMSLLFLMPQDVQAEPIPSAVKKSVQLQSGGGLVREKIYIHNNLDFKKDEWVYCVIKINGFWQKDITHRPSQKFYITVNGGKVFEEEVYGEKIITMGFDGNKREIKVDGYMQCCNAATNAKGSIEVICFIEKPEVFYVTDVTYDVKNARLVSNPEFPVGRETIEENNTDQESTGTYKATYTETNSLTWEKSFEHAESVGISIGYKAGASGGFEGMASLAANFKTAYKTGSTKQTSESIERSITYQVPAHSAKRIFAVQTINSYEMNYIMKGYTVNNDGVRSSPIEKKDKCIFVGVKSTRILQEPIGGKGVLKAGTKKDVLAEWPSKLK